MIMQVATESKPHVAASSITDSSVASSRVPASMAALSVEPTQTFGAFPSGLTYGTAGAKLHCRSGWIRKFVLIPNETVRLCSSGCASRQALLWARGCAEVDTDRAQANVVFMHAPYWHKSRVVGTCNLQHTARVALCFPCKLI
jgi:hypothetical protein